MGKFFSSLREHAAQSTDDRISKMSEFLSGIRIIKMYAWEKPFVELIRLVRKLVSSNLNLISSTLIVGTNSFKGRDEIYTKIRIFVRVCSLLIPTDNQTDSVPDVSGRRTHRQYHDS